jgi:hypothetical protein
MTEPLGSREIRVSRAGKTENGLVTRARERVKKEGSRVRTDEKARRMGKSRGRCRPAL